MPQARLNPNPDGLIVGHIKECSTAATAQMAMQLGYDNVSVAQKKELRAKLVLANNNRLGCSTIKHRCVSQTS